VVNFRRIYQRKQPFFPAFATRYSSPQMGLRDQRSLKRTHDKPLAQALRSHRREEQRFASDTAHNRCVIHEHSPRRKCTRVEAVEHSGRGQLHG
jgi:hypothetical protein